MSALFLLQELRVPEQLVREAEDQRQELLVRGVEGQAWFVLES